LNIPSRAEKHLIFWARVLPLLGVETARGSNPRAHLYLSGVVLVYCCLHLAGVLAVARMPEAASTWCCRADWLPSITSYSNAVGKGLAKRSCSRLVSSSITYFGVVLLLQDSEVQQEIKPIHAVCVCTWRVLPTRRRDKQLLHNISTW